MAKGDDGLSFSRDESEALKLMVGDWLNEEIVVPPFDPHIAAVLKKLGIAIPASAGLSSITQETASERGVIRPRTSDQ
jgi:hypothetical protein